MKKLIALILSLTFVLTLAGCGKTTGGGEPVVGGGEPVAGGADMPTVGNDEVIDTEQAQPAVTEDVAPAESDTPRDINSAGDGKEYNLSDLENWMVSLQTEVERLTETDRLTQEQADEIKSYYEGEISEIKEVAEAGGLNAYDKTPDGLEEVFYTIDTISFEPPALDEVFDYYTRKGSFLGIATNLPLNQ